LEALDSPQEATSGAAFFDLDRTLLAGSSALALAGQFYQRGLLSRRELVQAAAWQLVFTRYGASPSQAERMAGRGLERLRGLRPVELRELVASSLTPALRPRLYRDALELLEQHRAQGERLYLVSATIEEVVSTLASELGFDGALGTTAEVVDGRYTGRALFNCLGRDKLAAVLGLAERRGISLPRSTAYSDSATDIPLLKAVGNPVAVNPDRWLRAVARRRGWPLLEFRRPSPRA
jgi:HAD superfamily hydrolase (TIGR01490 family)